MQQEIETAVINAIATQKHIDANTITSDSSLQDLGVSSLDAITIVYEIEEIFDVTVPNEQLEDLRTVRDIVNGMEELLKSQDGG
jgi:acyl carrier protein